MLTLINILFLALLAYLGFHAAQNIRNSIKEPQIDTSTPVRPIHFADDARKIAAAKPLKDYPMIWKRNLFNISTKEVTAPGNKIAIEKIAIAKKDLGLKLVGTVVANDSDTSRALISNSDTRKQETYREGDTIGTVRIRKILRNKVIVSTPEGDRLLMVDIGGALRFSNPETHTPRRSAYGEYPQRVAMRKMPGRSITLERREVEASLANIGDLKQELNIEPYTRNNQPAGFTISSIPPQSILRKMGLKNGSAIMGINDEAFTGPEQAAYFFQTLAEGGEMTVKVVKGRGVRRRTRFMHLNIE